PAGASQAAGPAPSRPQPQHQAPPAAASAAPSAPAAPGPAAPAGSVDPRMLWPNILEAVKNRRRFTWILLSQNAQVTGFDGTTLQIGFVNAGARDNFASSGSEDVLRQALAEQFNVQWKIEALVDPSGGSAAPPAGGAPGFGGGGAGYGGGGFTGAAAGGGPAAAARPAAARPGSPAPAAPQGGAPSAPAPAAPARSAPPEPHPVAPEDDIPEDDDPDLDESALSGHDLIVRELGATVVEEFTNE
ncbi:DNA polymerase III subunit gamma and tau, partial [Streptomyces collinus]